MFLDSASRKSLARSVYEIRICRQFSPFQQRSHINIHGGVTVLEQEEIIKDGGLITIL
jgi:hypothetical protein